MFRHVLGIAESCFGVANVLVVSRSEDVLAIARSEGGVAVVENTSSDLNSALSQAAHVAAASRILILASDLPLVEKSDLAEMSRHACAIAPDRHERGTNALLWPVHLPFTFGENSFARHRAIAASAGFAAQIVERAGLAFDVDLPEDFKDLSPRNRERRLG
jgi:2-phospho-L-lactate guanylyltransferase